MKRVTYFISIFALFISCTALAKDIPCTPSKKGAHTSAAPSCPSPLLPESEQCHKLYEESKYAAAFPICSTLAENNDSLAQSVLGLMYYEGEGIPSDYVKAVYWIKKSAESGNAVGEHNLGLLYEQGRAVNQDSAEAFKWYEKAAKQDSGTSQAKIAMLYMDGVGTDKNPQKSIYWLKKSVAKNNAIGEALLGMFYGKGQGVEQDFHKSFEWLEKAANQGHSSSQAMLGLLYNAGTGTKQNTIQAYKWFYLALHNEKSPLDSKKAEFAEKNFEIVRSHISSQELMEAERLIAEWRPIIKDIQGNSYTLYTNTKP